MTETIAYIKTSLKGVYPPSEISGIVRLIMERICHIPPYRFLSGKDILLPESEKERIREITEHIKQMEPIQYIIGIADFYSLEFEVNPAVLIPRPETEELVEHIIHDTGNRAVSILDVGTGSGCIAVTLAKQLNRAKVSAADISSEALSTARRNAGKNGVDVSFFGTDILREQAAADIPGRFDIIVSNPPYIKEEEKKDMERNVLDYEPHLALFVPDEDPLLFYRAIARFGIKKLNAGGHLYFEINARCGAETAGMLCDEGYKEITLIKDLSGKDRILKAQL